MKKNLFFLSFLLKKMLFSYAFLFSVFIIIISYATLLSLIHIDDATSWILAPLFFMLNLFLLGDNMFEYKKNQNFFQDKKHYNFSIIFVLFIINIFFLLAAVFSVWLSLVFDFINYEQIDNSYFIFRDDIFVINWAFFYYTMILLALISYFFFEITYKFIKKSKDYYLLILIIFTFYFILNVGYLLNWAHFTTFNVVNGDTKFEKMNFTKFNTHYSYDSLNNTFYIYPYFKNTDSYNSAFRFWIIVIDPFFAFIYLFHMTTFSVIYTKEFFFYNHRFFSANGLRVKTAYFHLQLGTKYFWFMLYPYFYIMFLFLIKLFTNFSYNRLIKN